MSWARSCTIGALLAFGTFAGCTCSKNESAVATLDGVDAGVKATVLSVDREVLTLGGFGAGHAGGILYPTTEFERSCVLRIEAPQHKTLLLKDTPCDPNWSLEADPQGKRLAYRNGAAPWSVLYFGTDGRSFERRDIVASGAIEWSRVPTLEASLEAMYRERPSIYELDEIRATAGESRLADALVSLADVEEPESNEKECSASKEFPLSSWSKAHAGLSAAEKARVAAGLRPTLLEPQPEGIRLLRAALVIDLDDPSLAPHLARLAEARAAGRAWVKPGRVGRAEANAAEAFALLLRRLVVRDPARASAIACTSVANDPGKFDDRDAALAVLAYTRKACPAVGAALLRGSLGFDLNPFCTSPDWFCSPREAVPRVLCPPEHFAAKVRQQIERPLDGTRRALCFGDALDPGVYAAAALYAQAALPEGLARALRRQTYPITMPDAPRCIELDPDEKGKPCHLDGGVDYPYLRFGCDVDEPELTEKTSYRKVAVLRFDDVRKAATVVRSGNVW